MRQWRAPNRRYGFQPDGGVKRCETEVGRQFLAAQLNGKQVACKVLIGVSVLPTEEVGK